MDIAVERRYERLTTICAALAMSFAAAALWSRFASVLRPLMGAWVAIATLAAATALLSLRTRPRLAYNAAMLGAVVAVVAMVQYSTDWPWHSQWASNPIAPVCLLMLCVSQLALMRQRAALVEWLTLAVFALTFLELVDFIDGNILFSSFSTHALMTIHAAWACALLSVGMMFVQRQGFMAFLLADTAVARRTRRLLLAALLLPPTLGWLRIVGEHRGYYNHNFGLALFTMTTVVGFSLLLYHDARFLHASETHRAELDAAVAQRTVELERANDDLRKLDALKSEFLATVTHELLTPMNAVLGFTELMLDGGAGEPTTSQREYLGIVLSSGQHLRVLIEKMLFLTRLESGAVKTERAWFDMGDVMAQVASEMTPADDKVKLEVQPPTGPLPIFSDAAKVAQVLHDLVENALKFTHEGSVKVACEAHDKDVALVVSDTGIGIREEDLSRVFQPFRQADSSYSRTYEGVGLGLFTAKKLIDLLGGSIEVESKPQHGSRFIVTVPRSAG